MKKYMLLICLLLPILAHAQSIPEPGEWHKPGMGIMIYNDKSVSMSFESGDSYVEAEGNWIVEREGKYAGTLKLTMTVRAWICDALVGGQRINITPQPPIKYVIYLIKNQQVAQIINSINLYAKSRQINFNNITLQRGNARATRHKGNG